MARPLPMGDNAVSVVKSFGKSEPSLFNVENLKHRLDYPNTKYFSPVLFLTHIS